MSIVDRLREWKQWIDAHSPSEWDDAYRSSLQSLPGIDVYYVVYRWAQLALQIMLVVASVLEVHSFHIILDHSLIYYAKWLLYIPNWMLTANMLQALLGVVVVSVSLGANGGVGVNVEAVPPGSYKKKVVDAYTILSNTATNLSAYIAVGTAGVFYAMDSPSFVAHAHLIDWKIAVSVISMVVDLFVVRFPYILLNIHSSIVLCAYLLLTYIHYMVGALDRYTNKPKALLNWSNPSTAILSFVASVGLMEITSVALFGLYQVRRQFVTRITVQPPRHHHPDRTLTERTEPVKVDHAEPAPHPSDTSKSEKKKKVTPKQDKPHEPAHEKEAPDGQGHSGHQEEVRPQSPPKKKPSDSIVRRSREITPGRK